jgi:hypothetical protein
VLKVFNGRPEKGKLHAYMLVLLLRDSRSPVKYGRLIAGGSSDKKQPSLILSLNKKTRAFERR